MRKQNIPGLVVLVILLLAGQSILAGVAVPAGPSQVAVIREDFEDLRSWEPLTFEKIERHSSYSAVRFDGRQVLKASSDSSASGLVHSQTFDVFRCPKLTWTWRVESIYDKGDARRKSGDDYPLRLYVLFEFDPEEAGLGERLTFRVLKTLYGEYPPRSTLNYIWANKSHEASVLVNPYTDRARMIPIQTGRAKLGEWITESRNILEDYRLAFGEDPPAKARLAVMNDSDDTGEASTAYLDRVMVFAEDSQDRLRSRDEPNGAEESSPDTER